MTITDKIEDHMISYMREKRTKLTPKEQASVARCLSGKKKAGIKIDDQAIAICISESRRTKKSQSNNADIHVRSIKRIIPL